MSRHITHGPDFDSFCNRYSHTLLEIVKKRTARRLAAKRTARSSTSPFTFTVGSRLTRLELGKKLPCRCPRNGAVAPRPIGRKV